MWNPWFFDLGHLTGYETPRPEVTCVSRDVPVGTVTTTLEVDLYDGRTWK